MTSHEKIRNTDKILLRPRTAAELLDISVPALNKLIYTGVIGSTKINSSRRIPLKSLRSYVDSLPLEGGAYESA